jgi:hypothetical protein
MPDKLGELTAATDEDFLPDISFLDPTQQDRYSELADKLLGLSKPNYDCRSRTARPIVEGTSPDRAS